MEQSFSYPREYTKEQLYSAFLEDYITYIEGETDVISTLANIAAALHQAFGFFWVGFYLVHDSQWLHLGPFQGTVACTRIRYSRGVCGTAWATDSTTVVPDVLQFPGHIACSSDSRSEIVIPIHNNRGAVIAVLDIDSTSIDAFDEFDRRGLEDIVAALERNLAESQKGL